MNLIVVASLLMFTPVGMVTLGISGKGRYNMNKQCGGVEEAHGVEINALHGWRPMALNAHPTNTIVILFMAWIRYREAKSKMKTHIESCIISNALLTFQYNYSLVKFSK